MLPTSMKKSGGGIGFAAVCIIEEICLVDGDIYFVTACITRRDLVVAFVAVAYINEEIWW